MNPDEVVAKSFQGLGWRVVLSLSAESIRPAGVSAQRSARTPFLSFHEK
jgi:hypothetical protein